MTASLTTVVEHDGAFRTMLEYLGENPMDLLHLEKSSRAIRQFFVANDAVWWSCTGYTSFRKDDRLSTARDKVLSSMMVRRYQEAQQRAQDDEEMAENILVRGFRSKDDRSSLEGFTEYLYDCVLQDVPWQRGFSDDLEFGDDTSMTFAGLLEANLIHILKESFEFADHRTTDIDKYPIVENRDLDRASKSIVKRFQMEFKVTSPEGQRVPHLLQTFVPINETIIRELALRAGIIRLHPDTFPTLWGLFLKLSLLLLTRTGIFAAHSVDGDDVEVAARPIMVTNAAEILGLAFTKVYLDFEVDENGDRIDNDEDSEIGSEYHPDSEEEDDDDEDVGELDEREKVWWEDSDYDSEADSDYEYVSEEDVDLEYDTDE